MKAAWAWAADKAHSGAMRNMEPKGPDDGYSMLVAKLMPGREGSSYTLAFLLLLVLLCPKSAEALSGLSGVGTRNFVLNGNITLAYERISNDSTAADNRLSLAYNFALDGFVVNPRLLLFEVRTEFNQDKYTPGLSYNSYGFGTTLSFLNAQVRRGPLRLFPQPIVIDFDYYKSGESKHYRYGVNFFYQLPLNLVFFRAGKIISLDRGVVQRVTRKSGDNEDENETNDAAKKHESSGLLIPLPRIYFDYDSDKSSFSDSGRRSMTDHLNIRADTETEHGIYRLNYQYEKRSDTEDGLTTESRKQWLDLYVDYQFLNKEKATQLDINNQFSYSKLDKATFMQLLSRGIWVKRFGPDLRDNFSLFGSGNYNSTDTDRTYGGSVASSYSRYYSERFSNTLSGDVGYTNTKSNDLAISGIGPVDPFADSTSQPKENTYTATINNSSTYVFPKIYVLSGNLSAGASDNGPRYGLSLTLSTRTRIATSASFVYYHSEQGTVKTDNQKVGFNFSGGLLRDVYITSMNYYQVTDSSDLGKEKRLYMRGDVYWTVLPYRTSFGILHQGAKLANSVVDNTSTMIYATVSRSFRSKITLFERVSYSQSNLGQRVLTLDSSLTWIFRRLSLTAQYSVDRQGNENGTAKLRQRFFLSIKRDFRQVIRPFL